MDCREEKFLCQDQGCGDGGDTGKVGEALEGDGWHSCRHQVATCATGPQGARCDFGPGKGIGEGVGMTLVAAPASISSALPSLLPHYSRLCFQVVPCALFLFFFCGCRLQALLFLGSFSLLEVWDRGLVPAQGRLACSSILLTPNLRRIPAIIVCLRASGSQSC